MKPDKADELAASCDFSHSAYFNMESKILEKFKIDYIERKLDDVRFILKIPSQLVNEAMVLSYVLKCNIEIDYTYNSDEWSLTGELWHQSKEVLEDLKDYLDKDYSLFKTYQYTIWSPGA